MSRDELISRLAEAIAAYEGWNRPGSLARRLANPGCIRRWRTTTGRQYPTASDYVDFVAWARDRHPDASDADVRAAAEREGWRVLRVLIGRYIDGKLTQGRSPTLREMMAVYAPASDRNDPARYAAYVARRAGIPMTVPLAELLK